MLKINNIHRNQKGFIFPYAFMMILMATAFTLNQILIGLKTLEYIQSRSKSYLCLKSINIKTKNHIKYINIGNDSILAAIVLEKIPYTAAVGRAMKQVAKLSQQLLYISYMTNLMNLKYCSKKTSSFYVYTYPYKLSGRLYFKRNFWGLTQLKKSKWKTYIMTKRYVLQTKWEVKSAIVPSSNIQTKELGFDYY